MSVRFVNAFIGAAGITVWVEAGGTFVLLAGLLNALVAVMPND